MSVLQPFQFLKFSKNKSDQQRYKPGCGNDLCNIPVIPQGKFVPFAIISPSNVIGNVLLNCHDEAGGVIDYYNVQMQDTFVRNDCPAGYTGSGVTYTVPAGKYSSTISQNDADGKALADIAANGQAYANVHGYCTKQLDFYDQFDSSDELAYYSTGVGSDGKAEFSIAGGVLYITDNPQGSPWSHLRIRRNFNASDAQYGHMYRLSFDIVYTNLAQENELEAIWGALGDWKNEMLTVGTHTFDVTCSNLSENRLSIWISAIHIKPTHIDFRIDNVRLETL